MRAFVDMALTLGQRTDSDGVRPGAARTHLVRTTSPQKAGPACGSRPEPVDEGPPFWGWKPLIRGGATIPEMRAGTPLREPSRTP